MPRSRLTVARHSAGRLVVLISVTIPRRSGGMLSDSWHQPALRRRPVTTGSATRRVWVLWALVMALLGATVALWVLNNATRPQDLSPFAAGVPGSPPSAPSWWPATVAMWSAGCSLAWPRSRPWAASAEAYAIRAYLTGTLPAGDIPGLGGELARRAGRPPARAAAVGVPNRPPAISSVAAGRLGAGGVGRLPGHQVHARAGARTPGQPDRARRDRQPRPERPSGQRVILPYSVAVLSGWAAVTIAALAPLVRYRRAGRVERQQLKWLVFVLAVAVVGGLAAAVLMQRGPGHCQWAGGAGGHRAGARDSPRGRRGHPALPPVRHRPADQPHPGLWAAHRRARRGLRRRWS